MRYLRALSMVAVLALLLVGLVITPAPAAAYTHTGHVHPYTNAPGTTFTFSAHGFEPREYVGFWANTPSGIVVSDAGYSTRANHDGYAQWRWTAPWDGQPGTWTMVARGGVSGRERVIAFEVQEPDPYVHQAWQVHVEPYANAPGTTFTFSAHGFEPREYVGFWANTPSGIVVSDAGYSTRANHDGYAQWRWTAPWDGQPGTWTMVARGGESERERVIAFEILSR